MSESNDEFKFRIINPPSISLFSDDVEEKILSPLYCIRDFGSKWNLEFDLPLVEKKDLKVSIEGSTVTIEAKLREKYYESNLEYRTEFRYFKKSVSLPGKIKQKEITAKFANGRLSIIIPKTNAGTKIKIQ